MRYVVDGHMIATPFELPSLVEFAMVTVERPVKTTVKAFSNADRVVFWSGETERVHAPLYLGRRPRQVPNHPAQKPRGKK